MDDLSQRLETLSPAKRALLERRLLADKHDRARALLLSRRSQRVSARASFAQERMWFLQQLEPESAAYNVPRAIRIVGKLDLKLLERSLNEIVARHESLRTRFSLEDGTLMQLVAESCPMQIPVEDLSDLPLAEATARAKEIAKVEGSLPFDLGAGPVVRARLLRLGAEEHLLLLTSHHIVSDAWSAGILFQELITCYQEFAEHRNSPLPPLQLQYGDYAEWQRDWLQGDVLQTQLKFWRSQLADAPPVLDLPSDRPRPALTDRGASCTLAVSPLLAEQLRDLSRRAGTTLFMTLLAGFGVLLRRYSGAEDIVVGTPIAGRSRTEIENLIGFFINTLALRIDLRGNPSFETLLSRVKQTALAAYEHQDLPFEKVVEELKPERSNRIPLFQVMFQYQHGPRNFASIDGVTFTPEAVENETAKFDLSLGAYERDDALKLHMEYSTDLFDEETIQTMLSRFTVLLESIVSCPEASISSLEIMTPAERRQLLEQWYKTHEDFGPYEGLQEKLERQAVQNPTALAVIDGDAELTFADLNSRANQLAHYLRNAGVGLEVPVAVFVERSADMIVALFGVLKAGGNYVPLDVAYPGERSAYVLQDSRARVVLTQEKWRERLPATDCLVVSLDSDWTRIGQESAANPPVQAAAENAAYVIYTSGSTGQPKGVVGLHGATINRLEWMYRRFPFAAGEVCCQKTSLSFVDSIWEIFGPLLEGIPLVIFPDDLVKDVNRFVNALSEANVSRLVLVPSLLLAMLETEGEIGRRLLKLKLWTCSGEALSLPLAKRFHERLPHSRLLNLYGSSEVAADVTCYEIADTDQLDNIPLGWPIANTQLYVLDRYLQPLPAGVVGEICVGGKNLARGYFARPELTAAKFIPNQFGVAPGRLYRTGDLGRVLKNGALEYRGRTDHQVKIRGARIELSEIESALATHPDVRESVVVVREDDSGERRLVAYVLGSGKTVSSREVRTYLKQKLPDFMIPTAVVVLDEFPRTASGKVDRLSLPSPADIGRDYVAPRTLTEQIVAGVVAEILKVEEVGADDDFFGLGGHSLLIPRLISRLNDSFGVELPLRAVFDNPQISQLAEKLTSLRGAAAETPIVPVSRDGDTSISFAQESLWVIDQISPETGAYNISRALRLQGPLDRAALQAGIDSIVSRHEAVRTIFPSQDGKPVPVVKRDCEVDLIVHDLSDLQKAGFDEEVQRRVAEECRRPFNLTVGPLLRATLLRLADDEHILIVTMHHIISDRWSMEIFFDELVFGYNNVMAGNGTKTEALSLQYADFAHWQRKSLRGDKLDRSLVYWEQQLAGAPVMTDLPVIRQRPAIRSFQGARYVFDFATDSTALKNLAKAERVTLFMMLLGAFQTLLWTYSKHDDIVVGCPSAGRRSGTENIIGYFVNTLALRTNFSGDPTFREVMHRVADTTAGALTHEHVPFAKVVERLQPARRLDHNPLFQVWFVLQSGAGERNDFAGLAVEPYPIDSEVTRHDLQLTVWEKGAVLKAAFTYNTDILDSQTVAHLAEQLSVLLTMILQQPDIHVSELKTIPKMKTESRQLSAARRKPISLSPRQLVAETSIADGLVQFQPAVEGYKLLEWLQANRSLVVDKLQTTGAVLLRDFAVGTIPAFEKLLVDLAGELVEYSYRSTPRTQVSGKIYTSTVYPAHQTIPLHNEMSYSRQWPMTIGFFCVEPSLNGGETPIADSRKVFAQIDPAIREEFIRKQVMYVRNYDDALDLPWREVFQTSSRAEVENYCAKAGIQVQWHGDTHLRTSQVCQAVTKHPVTGEMVWFNQAHLFHVSSLEADVRNSLQSAAAGNEPRNAFFGDGTEIDEAALDHIRAVYDQEMVTFSWQRGDVLILDNILTAHGRKPYSGPRQIVVGMGRLIED